MGALVARAAAVKGGGACVFRASGIYAHTQHRAPDATTQPLRGNDTSISRQTAAHDAPAATHGSCGWKAAVTTADACELAREGPTEVPSG